MEAHREAARALNGIPTARSVQVLLAAERRGAPQRAKHASGPEQIGVSDLPMDSEGRPAQSLEEPEVVAFRAARSALDLGSPSRQIAPMPVAVGDKRW